MIRSGGDASICSGSERPFHPGDVVRSGCVAFGLSLPLHPVLQHRFLAWSFIQCFHLVLSFSEFCLDPLWEQEAFASIRSGSGVSIRSGGERPFHQSALGAMCRSALGARGHCIDPLWERCVDLLWEREDFAFWGCHELRERCVRPSSTTSSCAPPSFLGLVLRSVLSYGALLLFCRELCLLSGERFFFFSSSVSGASWVWR
jgi:hypothetical protein